MNPPINPMPEGVTPKVSLNPSTDIVEYPDTSASVEMPGGGANLALVLVGATSENYAGFDIPGVASSAAVWDEDFEAYVYDLPIETGVNSWVLTYNGVDVWRVSVNVTQT